MKQNHIEGNKKEIIGKMRADTKKTEQTFELIVHLEIRRIHLKP